MLKLTAVCRQVRRTVWAQQHGSHMDPRHMQARDRAREQPASRQQYIQPAPHQRSLLMCRRSAAKVAVLEPGGTEGSSR